MKDIIKEFSKLIFIVQNLVSHIVRAVASNNQASKKILTYLYLELLYEKSSIPSIQIKPANEYILKISSERILDINRKMDERFSLLTEKELLVLLTLMKNANPKTILEFGMMRGGSLYHFYLNTDENVKILSLDLSDKNLLPSLRDILRENPRIQIHLGNTRQFDPSPYLKTIDFIFIDAGHSLEDVKNDTEKALSMISPGGTIVWNDYHPHYPGVYEYLNELFINQKGLRHIEGTSLVFLKC